MAQYEANKIIQLLQFCSWKARTEISNTGLMELASKLGSIPDGNERTPNEKYLVDLLSDSRMALKKDNLVSRRKSYIDLLLKFGGFDGWQQWNIALFAASMYVVGSKQSIESTEEEFKTAIFAPESLGKYLVPAISFVKKSAYPLILNFCKSESPVENVEQLNALLDEYSFILWALPVSWKDQPGQLKEWKKLTQSGKVVPIWIDTNEMWNTAPPFIPTLKQSEILGGIPGLLTALLFIRETFLGSTEESNTEHSGLAKTYTDISFHDSSSGFINHGNIQSQNNTIQTITNHYRDN